MTANRALRELNDEGYVERVAGKGTFVADLKATSHLLEVRNIADEILRRGHAHSASVLRLDKIRANAELAQRLQLREGVEIFHVVLIHSENLTPIQYEDRYVVAEFAPDCLQQDFTATTPSAYLSSISPLQEAEHIVRAETPAGDIRGELSMAESEPCLVVSRRTWAHGRVVSFANLYHPGSRFELTGHYAPPGTPNSSHTRNADLRLEKRQ
jgi:GntR family histidine utilization transcriptional repressor